MNILKTLQFMKNDIKVSIWKEDPTQWNKEIKVDEVIDDNYIIYNDSEEFRPTAAEILSIDQTLVEDYINTREKQIKKESVEKLQTEILTVQLKLNNLLGDPS